MFLQKKGTDTLIKIVEPDELFDPVKSSVKGRDQEGQEEQAPESFEKAELVFPSGESLPRCWLDADYRLKS